MITLHIPLLPFPKSFLHLIIFMIDWPELSSSSFGSSQLAFYNILSPKVFHITKEQLYL